MSPKSHDRKCFCAYHPHYKKNKQRYQTSAVSIVGHAFATGASEDIFRKARTGSSQEGRNSNALRSRNSNAAIIRMLNYI